MGVSCALKGGHGFSYHRTRGLPRAGGGIAALVLKRILPTAAKEPRS